MCNQFFRPRATGRIEFSARLLLNSSSGYSRNCVSFLQSVSAYWQALLSALEGNATDCAASILLRICCWVESIWLKPSTNGGTGRLPQREMLPHELLDCLNVSIGSGKS